jgi:hypothetical protein
MQGGCLCENGMHLQILLSTVAIFILKWGNMTRISFHDKFNHAACHGVGRHSGTRPEVGHLAPEDIVTVRGTVRRPVS